MVASDEATAIRKEEEERDGGRVKCRGGRVLSRGRSGQGNLVGS